LLLRATYNGQHLPLTRAGADGQAIRFTYNTRGQLLTETNPKNETTTYTYDPNGYRTAVDGPLPGTNDLITVRYDALGRVRTKTDESGYTLTLDHDDMDRLVKITHPDSTFEQFVYQRLDVTNVLDRAGRQTIFEFDNVRQMRKKTDPLGRVTLFDWCRCGNIKSLTDPMGRTTTWLTDVQSRPVAKQ
jgi:YD repeat-containing protein